MLLYREEFEDKIIESLHIKGGSMTINEIAKVTKLSPPTVKKYMERLHKFGIVKKEGDIIGKRGNEENQEK